MADVLADGPVKLVTVGFFAELGKSRHYSKNLRDLVSQTRHPLENEIVDYLNSGYQVLDILETSQDVLDDREWIIGAPSLLSDGRFLWRRDLVHYVRKYHVIPPDEFIKFAKEHGFSVPRLSDPELERVTSAALAFF